MLIKPQAESFFCALKKRYVLPMTTMGEIHCNLKNYAIQPINIGKRTTKIYSLFLSVEFTTVREIFNNISLLRTLPELN